MTRLNNPATTIADEDPTEPTGMSQPAADNTEEIAPATPLAAMTTPTASQATVFQDPIENIEPGNTSPYVDSTEEADTPQSFIINGDPQPPTSPASTVGDTDEIDSDGATSYHGTPPPMTLFGHPSADTNEMTNQSPPIVVHYQSRHN